MLGAQFASDLRKKLASHRIPLYGHVELTYRCNFRCVHCYQTGVKVEHELGTHEWLRILDEAAAAGCLWLTISGGDPLVRRDFTQIYVHAVRNGFLVALFTNGALVTDEIADLIAAWPPQCVEISLYGATSETYKAVTGIELGYERAHAGIERLQARGIAVRLKTVVLDQTISELGAMEQYAAHRAAPFRFETMVHPTLTGDRLTTHHRRSSDDVVALERARPHRVAALRAFVERTPAASHNLVYGCGAGRWFFGVDPAGRMRLCPAVVDPSWSLKQMSFLEAWRVAAGELSRTLDDSPCANCEVIDMCPRCAALALMETGSLTGWSPYFGEIANRRADMVGRKARARCLGVVNERTKQPFAGR